MPAHRQLDQIKITPFTGINGHFAAITEDVERHVLQRNAVVPGIKVAPATMQVKAMRRQVAPDVLAHLCDRPGPQLGVAVEQVARVAR